MSKRKSATDRKAKKRKEREKRVRLERNLRRNLPRLLVDDLPEESEDEPDLAIAPFEMERMLRRAAETGQQRDDDDPIERAQELAYQAMETRDRRAAERLAREALSLHADCADALALLALRDRDRAKRIAALESAVAAGARALGGSSFFDEHTGHFWQAVITRPYMRARRTLADELRAAGRTDEAAKEYEQLLELNPGDNQGVRDSLLAIRLTQRDDAATRRLLDAYSGAPTCVYSWGAVLHEFVRGDRAAAVRALEKARGLNRHFEAAVDGEPLRARADGFVLVGHESEAAEAWNELAPAWNASPDAVEWIRSGAPLTTEEERQESIESYQPPVARLLDLGRASTGRGWRHEPLEDLGPEHTRELLRMLTDRALHEQDDDSAFVWAPIHALRALARLHAADAVEPILELFREYLDDDWLREDGITTLVEIGVPSLDALERLLANRDAPVDERHLASEVLGMIGTEHAAVHARCVAALATALGEHDSNDPMLNGALIWALADLGAREHLPLAKRAFDAGEVDTMYVGDWDFVLERFARR